MQNALSRAAPLPPRPLWLPAWQCLVAAGATRPFAQHKREWCYSTKVCKRERMQGTEVNFFELQQVKKWVVRSRGKHGRDMRDAGARRPSQRGPRVAGHTR